MERVLDDSQPLAGCEKNVVEAYQEFEDVDVPEFWQPEQDLVDPVEGEVDVEQPDDVEGQSSWDPWTE